MNTLTPEGRSKKEALKHSSILFLGVHNSQNIWPYQADLFFQNAQNFIQILNMEKKFKKSFLVLEIMVLKPVLEIFLNYDENT